MNSKNFIPAGSFLFTFLFLLFLTHPNAYAGESIVSGSRNLQNNRLQVFLDLPRWADENFIRQEIPVVDFVRDKDLAHVHIIMTRHQSGSAGATYFFSIIGSMEFKGMNNELSLWAPASNTSYENRAGYTNMIKVGLAPYIANTLMADKLSIVYSTDPMPLSREEIETEVKDPWNQWIFEIYGGGNFSKEDKRSSANFRYGFYADKITEDWKLRFRPYFNYSERNFVVDDGTITRVTHRNGFNGTVVKSLNDHWSAGIFTNMLSSTFHNIDFNVQVSPAIEYSLYPYREATRRSITFAYRVGYGYHKYLEETIFEKNDEYLFNQSLEASARFQQPWGTFRAGLTGSNFFHDFNLNRAEFFANLNLRIFQGFALNLSGNFDIINDLLAIPRGDLSLEDILLQQRRQATDYQVSGSIGLSYTFGSSLSGAYNPRL